MDSANEANAGGGENLNHIYFFLDPPAMSDERHHHRKDTTTTTATTANTSQKPKSRDSSPGSTGTGSSAAATGSAISSSSSNMNPNASPFQPGPSTSPEVAKPLYEIRQIAGKGHGLVAVAFIPRGTRIICEQPLLLSAGNQPHLAWAPYQALSNTDRTTFDQLHGYINRDESDGLENLSRLALLDPVGKTDQEADREVDEHLRVMRIFRTNAFSRTNGFGIYATAARLNHSCVPNTHADFNVNVQRFTVQAERDIHPGEELTIDYIGTQPNGQPNGMARSARIENLRVTYGFTCTCPACSDRSDTSDNRRELMCNILWGLEFYDQGAPPSSPFIPDGPEVATKLAYDAINFMLAEELQGMELRKAFHAASKYALASKNWDAALDCALRAQEVERSCLGTEVQDLRKKGEAASCWVEHVQKVMRETMGKKPAKEIIDRQMQARKGSQAPKPAKHRTPETLAKQRRQKEKKTAKRAEKQERERAERAEALIAKGEKGEGKTEGAGKEGEGKAEDVAKHEQQQPQPPAPKPSSWATVAAGGKSQKDTGYPALRKDSKSPERKEN